jgi:HD-like signal output (HDOD) protein/CheY-like chemotaxis protein
MPTVLVVEDDRNIQTVVGRILRRHGHEPIPCASAEEARDAVARGQAVDVLLLDLRLPGMDGYTFLRQLQRERGRVPVVIMTGAGTMDDAVTAVRLRASDFLQKPFDEQDLAQAIDTALRDRAWLSSGELPALPRDGAAGPPAGAGAAAAPEDGGPPGSADGTGDATGGGAGDGGAAPTRRAVQLVLAAMQEVERRLAAGRIELPVLDSRMSRLQRLRQQLVCGVDEVLDLVGNDQALAATCLRAANSSLYGATQPIKSLRQACVQLGNRRVMAFAAEALVQGAFQAQRPVFRAILAGLWRSSLLTARTTEQLARHAYRSNPLARTALPPPDELHVAALLHNVGELLLLRLLDQVPDFDAPDETTLAVLGEAVHARHESFGGRLARRWALPKLVTSLAGAHHRPGSSPEPNAEALVRHLVVAAWAMTLRGGFGYLPSPPPPAPDELLAEIGVDPEQVSGIYEELPRWLEALEQPAAA